MTNVDARINQLVQEIADSAPLPVGLPEQPIGGASGSSGRFSRLLVVGATAVVAVAAGWALVSSDGQPKVRDPGQTVTSADGPSPTVLRVPLSSTTSELVDESAVHQRSLEERLLDRGDWRRATLGGDTWLFPTYLPSGFDFRGATDGQAFRQTVFEGPGGDSIGVMLFLSPPLGFAESGQPVHVADEQWMLTEDGTLERMISDIAVMVDAVDLPAQELLRVAASLDAVAESDLPLPVLRPFQQRGWTEVGSATIDGFRVSVEAHTDGERYAIQSRSGSTIVRLGEDRSIALASWAGPDSIRNAPVRSGVFTAIVDPTVAVVELELDDGSTLTATPQDSHDTFVVDFIVVAVPSSGDGVHGPVRRVVAFDSDGIEIDEEPWPRTD